MNRQKLLKYLSEPHALQSRHVPVLEDMVKQYPYATVLRLLLAKASAGTTGAKANLANAALYTPNRSRLRSFIEEGLAYTARQHTGAEETTDPIHQIPTIEPTYSQPVSQEPSPQPTFIPEHDAEVSPSSLEDFSGTEEHNPDPDIDKEPAVEVIYQPEEEVQPVIFEETDPAEASTNAEADFTNSYSATEETSDTDDEITESEKGKTDIFKELEENLKRLRQQREKLEPELGIDSYTTSEETTSSTPVTEPEPEEPASFTEEVVIEKSVPNETLKGIVEQYDEQNLDNTKVRYQRSLISSFLSKNERIGKPAPPSTGQPINDLSEESATTPPDLVTETLANIMVRQGKFNRAIDIYEKLMLKYPQKNTYFAGRIEQLKNEL